VYDFGEAEGYPFIVMRYVEGSTLADKLKGKPLSLEQLSRVIRQVGDALDYAHQHGVIHRDVKPSNILIDSQGNCLLSDFGLAKMIEGDTHLTMTGSIMGTPAYMSPEQGLGEVLDKRTDVYSLGVVLYEMAVGRVPYEAETPMAVVHKHIYDPLPLPRSLNPSLSEGLEPVILKALAKDKASRYETAAALADALERATPKSAAGRAAKRVGNEAPTEKGWALGLKGIGAGREVIGRPMKPVSRLPSTLGARRIPVPGRRIFIPILAVAALTIVGLGLFSWIRRGTLLSPRPAHPPTAAPASPPAAGAAASATRSAQANVTPMVSATTNPQLAPAAATHQDISRLRLVRTLKARNVIDLAWSSDGGLLAVGGQSLSVWSVKDDIQSEVQLAEPIALSGDSSIFQRDSSLSWRPNSTLLEISGFRKPVWIFDESGSGEVKSLETENTGGVITAAWSPQGTYLAMGNSAGDVVLWDPSSDSYPYLRANRRELASDVAWSPDGVFLASASWDATVQIWRIPTQTLVKTLTGFIGAVSGLEWSPGGAYLASTDLFSGDIVIWDTAHWSRKRILKGHVAWSPDDTFLAIASEEGVRIETGDGQEIALLPQASAVQWAPAGDLLAASANGVTRIFRTGSWDEVYSIEGGSEPLEWSPGGEYIAVVDKDGNVAIWEVPSPP
jgi:hypothetical protein